MMHHKNMYKALMDMDASCLGTSKKETKAGKVARAIIVSFSSPLGFDNFLRKVKTFHYNNIQCTLPLGDRRITTRAYKQHEIFSDPFTLLNEPSFWCAGVALSETH